MTGRGWIVVAGLHINSRKLSVQQRVRLELLRLVLATLVVFGIFGTFQFSRVGAQYALDIVTGRNAGPGARTTYLALLTALPGFTTTLATMAETTMTGYARQTFAFTAPSAADPPETHNSGVLAFGPLTGVMVTISHFALSSAVSGTVGDYLAWGALTNARTPLSGDSIQAAIAAFSLTNE